MYCDACGCGSEYDVCKYPEFKHKENMCLFDVYEYVPSVEEVPRCCSVIHIIDHAYARQCQPPCAPSGYQYILT
jgi:hypothetical protein